MMRIRSVAAVSLIGLLAYCAEPTGESTGSPGFASVVVRASAPPSLSRFAPALVLERVRIRISRLTGSEQSELIKEETRTFSENTNALKLNYSIAVNGTESIWLQVIYQTATGTELFTADSYFELSAGQTTESPTLNPFYTGPGSDIFFLTMSGDDSTVDAGADVQLDVTAFNSQGVEIPEFYLTWETDDPRVPISPRGLLRTRPNVTQELNITARTPNGRIGSTRLTVQGTEAMALAPDSVALRPAEEQVFDLTVGRDFDISTTWSVGGIDGGNATLGTISESGIYTAPSSPMPGRETQVCVRNSNNADVKGCAKVRMPASGGNDADVVLINDLNLFDDEMMANAGNQRFVQNLIASTGGGTRSLGSVVWSERARDSRCMPPFDTNAECGDVAKAAFFSAIEGDERYFVQQFDSTAADLTEIPSNVRTIIFWMPTVEFSRSEVNGLKLFAAQGGRIIFIGENLPYYTQLGLDVENKLLVDLGGSMVNRGDLIDCINAAHPNFWETTPRQLRVHPLMTGVSSLRYACASEVRSLGPNDKALFYDSANRKVLGAVAAISLVPLPPLNDFVRKPVTQTPSTVRGSGARR